MKQQERIEYLIFCIMNKIEEKVDFVSSGEKKQLEVTIKEVLEENINVMRGF